MELNTISGNHSIMDYLVRFMPGKLNIPANANNYINPKIATDLYKLWKNESNKVGANTYRRPVTLSKYQLNEMTQSGLVKEIGHNIEITKKGSDIIKVMLLGDDSSIFDERENEIIDYSQALSNTKSAMRTSKTKTSFSYEVEDKGIKEDTIWKDRFSTRLIKVLSYDKQVGVVKIAESFGDISFIDDNSFIEKFKCGS